MLQVVRPHSYRQNTQLYRAMSTQERLTVPRVVVASLAHIVFRVVVAFLAHTAPRVVVASLVMVGGIDDDLASVIVVFLFYCYIYFVALKMVGGGDLETNLLWCVCGGGNHTYTHNIY